MHPSKQAECSNGDDQDRRATRRTVRLSVAIPTFAFDEAVVGQDGYRQLSDPVRELARQDDPSHSATVDVRPIESFHEIRNHVGNLNVRVFFGLDHTRRAIVILGCIKKQNNGPTPLGHKVRMRTRWDRYQRGEFGFLE